jgi:hypothetical protein
MSKKKFQEKTPVQSRSNISNIMDSNIIGKSQNAQLMKTLTKINRI